MKAILTTVVLCIALAASAQTTIDKTIPVSKGQSIRMKFDYPSPVKISTWDRNEISIKGTVSINSGEHDDHFKIDVQSSANTIMIRNEVTDMKNIPSRITVREGNKTITFRNKSEFEKYQSQNGNKYNVNMGIDFKIVLEIKVPRNVETDVECVYGIVEIPEFVGPLTVQATYGGVDVSLNEKNVGELIAETNYGNIYTNLDMNVNNGMKEEDFHTLVKATPGTGPRYRFESPYGNVYLRKSK